MYNNTYWNVNIWLCLAVMISPIVVALAAHSILKLLRIMLKDNYGNPIRNPIRNPK